MKQPWMDQAGFRASLPKFGNFQADSVNKLAYSQFYGLQFEELHKHHIGLFRSQQFELVAQIFQSTNQTSRGTLFVYHGYFDHLGLYGFPIKLGLSMGFTVVGFDLPGHGLSSGAFAAIDCFTRYTKAQAQFVKAIQSMPAACPRPWAALGQSTGSAVILEALLLEKKAYYDQLILLAPLLRVSDWYSVRVLYQLLRYQGGIARTFKNNSANLQFVDFLRDKDPLQHRRIEASWVGAMIRYTKRIIKARPVALAPLVLQGDCDETVDFQYNIPMLNRLFSNPTVVMIPGAKHHLVNEDDQYRDIMAVHIKAFLSAMK